MKKHILFLLLLPFALYGQSGMHNSWDGISMKPDARIRSLNFFINIIYDAYPEDDPLAGDRNGSWPSAFNEGINNEAVPVYLKERTFLDTGYVSGRLRGCMTRVYGEASFGALQLTGDFVVINIRESRILKSSDGYFDEESIISAALDYLNAKGFRTLYGHDAAKDYGITDGRIAHTVLFPQHHPEQRRPFARTGIQQRRIHLRAFENRKGKVYRHREMHPAVRGQRGPRGQSYGHCMP